MDITFNDEASLMWDQPEGMGAGIEQVPVAHDLEALAARTRAALSRGSSTRRPVRVLAHRIETTEAGEPVLIFVLRGAQVRLTPAAAEKIATIEPGRLPHA